MAQYVARFIPRYSDIVVPLQNLTHQNQRWRWRDEHQKAFDRLKGHLANTHSLSYYDTSLDTELVVDASPVGVGAILTQKSDKGEVRVVEYSSRRLTDTETRYSQTEREALAVVWACEHFHIYLYGAQFQVISDHKPLEGIMNNPLSKPTSRLERLCLRLQPYKMRVQYQPGKFNQADFLSRHPKSRELPPGGKSWINKQTEGVCVNALQAYEADGMTRDVVRKAMAKDETMQKLMQAINSQRWHTTDDRITPYKKIKEELCTVDGLILRGDRLVIPESLHQKAVDIAHNGHQGIVKTKGLPRETLWFPGIDRMVEHTIA